ncbi:oxalurate catabolism protein HpxZ [Aquincola sp. S2]|uniref:Oxalurate catabolism protein HpxZ n=1 Tax=Pseudaquabacterium terrae TaxID=2732868 RepID=A0ABX2EHE6_9BURK|nr:oxalurate catabolism protein HpxZ [Aquabacterium terrae]NRF68006.1 oxalurate catabolism protein HpxZ [Aquabacterium terrae]
MKPDAVDRPDVVAEIQRLFADYERALMTHDLTALDAFFWDDPRTTRYGIADRQWGIAQLRSFRAASPAPRFTRRIEHLRIRSFGADCAVAQCEFVRSDSALRGFQSQTWVRLDDAGWKIVAAHVSMIGFEE